VLLSSLDTEITSDDPFLPLLNFLALMQHTIAPMSVEKRHAHLEFCHNRRRRSLATTRSVRVEDSFATLASSGRRRKI